MAQSPRPTGGSPQGRQVPPPKEPTAPPPRSFAAKAVIFVAALAGLVLVGMIVHYSVQIGRGPWSWSNDDSRGFVDYSKERVDVARGKMEEVDWASLGTRATAETKRLWERVPEV